MNHTVFFLLSLTHMAKPLYDALVSFWDARTVPLAVPARYRHMRSPTMAIDNVMRTSEAFRKVHVEHATTATGLDILHSVAYPRAHADAPILGLDLVCFKGRPTMGICDLSGGGYEGFLSYKGIGGTRRELPEWGRALFSSECVFQDSPSLDEFSDFLEDVARRYAAAVEAMPEAPAHRRRFRTNFEKVYFETQCQNPRTYGVLANAFGPREAEDYMRDIMFG